LVLIFIIAGVCNASLLCSPAIADRLAAQLLFTPQQIGLFFSMEFGGYIVAGLAGRWLLPRYNWQTLALLSLLAMAAGNLLTIWALQIVPLLLLVRLATASSGALLSMIAMATAAETAHPSRAISIHIIGQLATGVVGLAILPSLFAAFGMTGYFVVVVLLVAAIAPAIGLLAKGKGLGEASSHQHLSLPKPIALLRHPALLLFYIALGGIWTFAGALGTDRGIAPATLSHILSGATLAGVFGAVLAAAAPRNIDLRPPVVGGFSLLTVGGGLLLALGSHPAFVAGMIAIKFAWSFALPFAVMLIGRLDRDGRLFAEMTVVVGIGLAVGPLLAGYLVESLGYRWMLAAEFVLLLGSCLSISIMALVAGRPVRPVIETG
jgi:MFS family permease